ncbi:(2Fe-2S)-binding protein [Paenirhodobacter sp.]|uniref:(2Fe-2S)-binding protein n=1 Tax=Paenirhodobacter sp. TaxID=1965326 RepID=UPI003B40B578
MTTPFGFILNGSAVTLADVGRRTLLDVLRADCGLNGPKYGCGMAQCGACTVLVDDSPARACVLAAARVAGRRVTTLEGLADPVTGALHPVQRAFVEKQAAQCGYCLNGMVMTAVALLRREPAPDRARIRAALRDNLCRCGTHLEILDAVARAAEVGQDG